jgi:transcriptional regulator with GAF, ATPase, and Fis domain
MNNDRERPITDAFVAIANSLVDGFDVVELLSGLTTDCARLLDIASAGLLLADTQGVLHVMAASSEATRNLELYQLQRDEGPCLDCYRSAAALSVVNLDNEVLRWPHFVAAATAAGFASVHAVPMKLRDKMLGALGLFGTRAGPLAEADLRLAQALADVASIAIVADKVATDNALITQQLQTALTSRVILEQAKGLLAQLGTLEMDDAFAALRRYARDHNTRLSVVAQVVVSRELPAQLVLDHAWAKGELRQPTRNPESST